MRKALFVTSVVLAAVSGVVFSSQAENVSLRGDYVEVRTASVFAGACHYNGEVTTTGRDAMLAWNVTSGKWQGVDLTGVRVMAIITASSNLSDSNAARESEVVIDTRASRSQALAMLNALHEKYAATLGKIVSVKYAPVSFAKSNGKFSVAADDASINVEALPNDLCCKMPNLVWYSPLVGVENRKVGYTTNAAYTGDSVSEPWMRSGENSAFYGTFSL
ncbi:MAG: DUF1326 domain-containing protein [Pyrinomonadaceae bacterium]